jgi:hypothetical protein
VSKPVNVAWLITVCEVKSKSSADSISNLVALDGLDAVAIRPSGFPVLKEKGSAAAGVATKITTPAIRAQRWGFMRMALPPFGTTSFCKVNLQTTSAEATPTLVVSLPCPMVLALPMPPDNSAHPRDAGAEEKQCSRFGHNATARRVEAQIVEGASEVPKKIHLYAMESRSIDGERES